MRISLYHPFCFAYDVQYIQFSIMKSKERSCAVKLYEYKTYCLFSEMSVLWKSQVIHALICCLCVLVWWQKRLPRKPECLGTMMSKGTHSCSCYYYAIICLFKWCAMPTNYWTSIKVHQENKNVRTKWTGNIYHLYITEIYCVPSDCSLCDTQNYALNVCTTTRVATLSDSREHQSHPRCCKRQTLDSLFSRLQGAFAV